MPNDQATGTLEEIGQRDHSVTSEYRIFGPPGTGKTTNLSRQNSICGSRLQIRRRRRWHRLPHLLLAATFEMWFDDYRADSPSFGLKSRPDSLAFLWAQYAPAQFERADFEPADAGDASQLAL